MITLDCAAAIHEHNLAMAHGLGFAGAMWIGGGFAEQDQAEFGRGAERRVRRVHQGADVLRGHTGLDAWRTVAVCGDGDVGSLLHERKFSGGLHHAAGARYGRAVHDRDARHRASQCIHGEEAHGVFDRNWRRDSPVAQEARDGHPRILVLVPDTHLGRDAPGSTSSAPMPSLPMSARALSMRARNSVPLMGATSVVMDSSPASAAAAPRVSASRRLLFMAVSSRELRFLAPGT
jgi:hypothetical protein